MVKVHGQAAYAYFLQLKQRYKISVYFPTEEQTYKSFENDKTFLQG